MSDDELVTSRSTMNSTRLQSVWKAVDPKIIEGIDDNCIRAEVTMIYFAKIVPLLHCSGAKEHLVIEKSGSKEQQRGSEEEEQK